MPIVPGPTLEQIGDEIRDDDRGRKREVEKPDVFMLSRNSPCMYLSIPHRRAVSGEAAVPAILPAPEVLLG